jgi:hypothetical protein
VTLLTNSAEGITPSGTTVTTANSGGASGNAFDVVTVTSSGQTCASDSARSAHGALSIQLATGATAAGTFVRWNTSMGTQTTIWFRVYAYYTANPASNIRIWNATASGTSCGSVLVSTTGKLLFANSAGTTVLTSTNSIPLNAWFRLEGFLTGNASTGQLEFKLFLTPDAVTPDETQTSAATQATTGPPTDYTFGNGGTSTSNFGPIWIDDLALSSTGYPGPVVPAGMTPVALPPVMFPPLSGVFGPNAPFWSPLPSPPLAPAVVAAAPQASRPQAVSRRLASRARIGGRGLCAAGILATGIGPPPVPAPHQPPSITHPAPHRAQWRSGAGVVPAATPQPFRPVTVYRRTPHAALWRAGRGSPPAAQPQPSRPVMVFARPQHRVLWRGITGPPVTVTPGTGSPQPFRPATIWRRTPHRAFWDSGQGAPPAGKRQPFTPVTIWRRIAHRAIWDGIAGQPAPFVPPPPFTIGALTAADTSMAVLTAAQAASALTASTGASAESDAYVTDTYVSDIYGAGSVAAGVLSSTLAASSVLQASTATTGGPR